MSLEWMMLFLQVGLGLSGVDVRSTAYGIEESNAINI